MEFAEKLLVKRICEKAFLPKRGTPFAAGYDLFSNEKTSVPAGGKALVKTGLAMAIPLGNYGRIAPRSGLAAKSNVHVGAGVIDTDYRGEVCVLLLNHSKNDHEVNYGDRVAQLIIEKITHTEVHEVSELTETERGAGGFGSTGVSLDKENMPMADNTKFESMINKDSSKKRKIDNNT